MEAAAEKALLEVPLQMAIQVVLVVLAQVGMVMLKQAAVVVVLLPFVEAAAETVLALEELQ